MDSYDDTPGHIGHDWFDRYDEESEQKLLDDELNLDELFGPEQEDAPGELSRRRCFHELFHLQRELVKLQNRVVHTGHKVVTLFEGRDAAGKGGVVKRIIQRLDPRVCRVAVLPAPNDRGQTQWYFQHYASHLPAGGEIVLFDHGQYNHAGVERVMNLCNGGQHEEFFRSVPKFERMLARLGIQLFKYRFSVPGAEQYLHFLSCIHDLLKQWKLSPMDLELWRCWEVYTKTRKTMLERTYIPEAPWWVIQADDKKRTRLNHTHHLLQQMPCQEVPQSPIHLPGRLRHAGYVRHPTPGKIIMPEVY